MKIINSTDTIPIKPTYFADDSVSLGTSTLIENVAGYRYYDSDIMNSMVDSKVNKHMFLGLTTEFDIIDVIDDELKSFDLTGPIMLTSASDTNKIIGVDYNYLLIQVSIDSENAVLMSFEHVDTDDETGDKYYTISYRDKVVTLDGTDHITLDNFTSIEDQSFRMVDGGGGSFNMKTRDDSTAKFDGNELFYISRDNENYIPVDAWTSEVDGFTTSNKWIRYEDFYAPEYSTTPSILTVNESGSISGVKTSLLMNFPIDDISTNGTDGSIGLDIIPTKNFKTFASEISIIPDETLSGSNVVDFRDYSRIYSGGSQVDGYAGINLGYTSKYSSVIRMNPDVFTFFHLPRTMTETTIQNSGLEFAGANSGNIPKYGDRIYKRLSNYEDKVWWGGGEHNKIQNGSWLCAWLSGDGAGLTEWVERYYDPGQLDAQEAWDATTITVSEEVNFAPNLNPVQDVISTMTLEPGAYYKYFHVGTSESILDIGKSAVLKFSDFTLSGGVYDETGSGHNGTIYNYDSAAVVSMDIGFGTINQSAILTNKEGEIHVNGSSDLNIEGELSVAGWFYSKDWATGRTTTLFSNYHKGGYKAEYINHGSYYSYAIPDGIGTDHELLILPSELSGADQIIETSNNLIKTQIRSVAIDLDGAVWCAIQNGSDTTILKTAPNGSILESVTINGKVIDQLVIADDNLGYVKVGNNVYTLNLNTIEVGDLILTTANDSYIYLTDYDPSSITSIVARDVDLFENGDVCHIDSDGNLFIDGLPKPISGRKYKTLACDGDNIVVSISEYNSGTVMDIQSKDGLWYWSSPTKEGSITDVNIPFFSKEMLDGVLKDVIYWVSGDTINKYYITDDFDVVLLQSIELDYVIDSISTGDYSGYRLNKRTSVMHDSSPYLKFSIVMVNDSEDIHKQVVCMPVNTLSDNWHHFVLVKDDTALTTTVYVDGESEVTEANHINDKVLYSSGSMLNIGGASVGGDSLFDVIDLDMRSWNGAISEFTIYNEAIDSDDVESLYQTKFASDNVMNWVIDNGDKYFVEEIDRFFKFKKPGQKSQLFNIIIKNLVLSDAEKIEYESYIRSEVLDALPANAKLVEIIWR